MFYDELEALEKEQVALDRSKTGLLTPSYMDENEDEAEDESA